MSGIPFKMGPLERCICWKESVSDYRGFFSLRYGVKGFLKSAQTFIEKGFEKTQDLGLHVV